LLEDVVNKEEFSKAATSKSSDIVLLDVRSYEEFALGTIPGAITIPADEVSDRIVEIPPGKQVYIYCKSGVRAEMVYNLLKDRGRSSKYLNNKVSVEEGGAFFIGDDTRKQ
jgi:rhodanese-related sulfurtransferase